MKNPVAKNARKFNKGGPMRDRKKDDKRGYMKHKGKQLNGDAQQTDTSNRTNAAAKKPQNYVDPETGKTKTRMVPVHKDVQNEKLNPSQGIKAYIDDFQKSDAPQFQGKSASKRKEMAIAAYLDAKRGEKKEACWDGYAQKGMKKKGDKMVPNCVPEAVDNYKLLKQLGQGIPKPTGNSRPNPGASKKLKKNMSAAAKAKQAARIKKALDREKRKDKPGMTKRSDDYNKKKYQSGASGRFFSRKYEDIDELYYKVNVEGLPTMIVDAESPTKIKANFRKLFKNPDKVVQDVERVSTAEVQKHFRLKSQGKDDMDEGYNPRAARAQSHAANKMYGRTSDPIDKKPASAAKKPISKVDLFRAIDKKYGSAKKKTGIFATRKEETQMDEGNPKLDQHPEVKKRFNAIKRTKPDSYERRRAVRRWSNKRKELMNNEDAEARARLKLKHTKEKENLKNRHSKEREAMKESMDPRDFTDKPGHVVVVKKKDGTRMIKHYHPTSTGAKKYADRVNKVNRVGDKATVHKTDGRKIHEASQKLTDKKAELRKKMFGNANYLSPAQRKELDKAAKAALQKDRAAKKAAPAPAKPVSKTSKGKVRSGSEEIADRNIFMQLRKAQERGGNQAITVSPTGRKVTLNPGQIDMILKRHDSLQKPVDKRKFKIMLIKSLRAKAK